MTTSEVFNNILSGLKGRFFTVTFIKQNGETRKINGKIPNKKKIDKNGNYTIFNVHKREFKKFNPNRIIGLNFNDINIKT